MANTVNKNIIVALDGISTAQALSFAEKLKGSVWGFKVNDLLFEDDSIIGKLKQYGNVFADAKLHDIPNTVANSVERLSLAGADIITVHVAGGEDMLRAAKGKAGRTCIVGVTELTSRDAKEKDVKALAEEALQAGVDGIVCSAWELQAVNRLEKMKDKLRIVPGIRPLWYKSDDDQVRTTTPRDALLKGATLLVVGRPITTAEDPLKALQRINEEI